MRLEFQTGEAARAGRFNYFETVPANKSYPSQVIQSSPNLLVNGGNPVLAYEGGGNELWTTGSGFGAPLGTLSRASPIPVAQYSRNFP